ncbi:hypothetical protein PUN28_002917 [Cardiocondyla obscurior]|uniref:Uncharacterized protein n=1 Tax=Cardiocondyla obscurior TaxID=286306 RepID=A0AAW2GWQ3_9HYME
MWNSWTLIIFINLRSSPRINFNILINLNKLRVALNIRENPRAVIIPVHMPAGFLLLKPIHFILPLSYYSRGRNAERNRDRRVKSRSRSKRRGSYANGYVERAMKGEVRDLSPREESALPPVPPPLPISFSTILRMRHATLAALRRYVPIVRPQHFRISKTHPIYSGHRAHMSYPCLRPVYGADRRRWRE